MASTENSSGRADQIVSGDSQRLPIINDKVLLEKRPQLEKYLRLNELLTENARLRKIIPGDTTSELFSLETDCSSTKANRYFIDFLIKSGEEEKWKVFVEAVRKSHGQDLLRDTLFDTNLQELQQHKKQEARIEKDPFRNELLQRLDASEFLLLFNFDDFDREKINCCKKRNGNKAANVLILKSIMKYKGWFSKLLEILRGMGHEGLATKLQDGDNEDNADGPPANTVAGNTRSRNQPLAPFFDDPDRAARTVAAFTHHQSDADGDDEATEVKVVNSLSTEEEPSHRDCPSPNDAERPREIGFHVIMKQRQEQANLCHTLPEKNASGLSTVPDKQDCPRTVSTSLCTPNPLDIVNTQNVSLTPSRPVVYRCFLCHSTFTSEDELHKHEIRSHSRTSATIEKQRVSPEHVMHPKEENKKFSLAPSRPVVYRCSLCRSTFIAEDELQKHKIRSHSRTSETIDKQRVSPGHVMHPKEENKKLSLTPSRPVVYRCSLCRSTFTSEDELHKHEIRSHSRTSETIDKQRVSPGHVMHLKEENKKLSLTPSRQVVYRCSVCPCSFISQDEQQKHEIRSHSRNSETNDKHRLSPRHATRPQEHQKVSLTPSRPDVYRCSLCRFTFISQNELQKHEISSHSRTSEISDKQRISSTRGMRQQ
ncbi:Zinc finger protein [Plakobranchus ocellatus]|uniref:Zinc finger protein n=1 Tax=Plakobranchus ocellatus TaxID=259542 RepID=A0AAV4C711_9GAST|nr:Zinc finger protein [Plakobranchus ocellatus]